MGRQLVNSITEEEFKVSSIYLRASLAYFEPESEFELRCGDGLEEFIFALYEMEKKRSGIDYLCLDESNFDSGQNTYSYGESQQQEYSNFNKTQREDMRLG
jgi:hypothetical protein